MPQLPRYESRRDLTTQQPAQVRTGAAQDVASVGGPILKAGQEMAQKWQEAQNVMDRTKAETYLMEQTRENMLIAANDPDPNNADKYIRNQEKISREAMQFIRDKQYASQLQLPFNQATIQNKIKIDGMFKKKEVDQYIANLNQEMYQTREIYLETNNLKARNNIITSAKNSLKAARDIGVITNEKYQEQTQDIEEDWEYAKAIRDASEDPEYVINNLDQYNLKPEDKPKVKSAAKTVMDQQDMQFKINQQKRYLEGKNKITQIMADENQTYIEKLTAIEESFNNDYLTEKESETYKKWLNSKEPDKSISYADELADALLYVESFNKSDTELKDLGEDKVFEYLKSINNYKEYVNEKIADKKITPNDGKKILKKIDDETIEEITFATEEVVKKEDRGFFNIGYGYRDAYNDIKGKLSDEMMSQRALRDYFNQVEGEGLPRDQREQIAENIANRYKQEFLNEVVKTSKLESVDIKGNKVPMDKIEKMARENNTSISMMIRVLKDKYGKDSA